MAGYTRQSVAEIIAGAVVKAAPINAEYNAIRDAFVHATGHKHDGTAAEGAYVPLISDPDNYNKVVLDENNNTIIFSVQVSNAGVAQVRIQDGVFFPIADNDIDLGTSANEFKDLYLDGTAKIDTLTVDENATVAGTLGVTGATTLSDNLSVGGTADVTGNTTLGGTLGVSGATTLSSTLGVSGATTLSSTLAVTGALTASGGVTGNLTGNVTGNVTGNLTGNVTAGSGTSTFNDIVVTGNATISGLQDYYLGPFSSAPTQDLGGNPLEDGDLYFDTTDNILYVYSESDGDWVVAAVNENAVLQVANNLSDLNNAATALTNLGLTATATEINYTDGVTSPIQTQLDTKTSTGKAIAMAIVFGG